MEGTIRTVETISETVLTGPEGIVRTARDYLKKRSTSYWKLRDWAAAARAAARTNTII
jgi:hypothetical protein